MARRVLKELSILLHLVQDEQVFITVSYKEIQSLEDALLRGILSSANIMASLGDKSGYTAVESPKRNKGKEHGHIIVTQ